MVDRTRIPTAMYPSGYTPSTPSGVATPAVMTKDGSGKPILEEMIEDYACGDEPGHYFISSPLNIYALARNSSVVLYVEGGCANFTWESDNEWATFGTSETSVRYNTLSSSADEGQDTVVTVTDDNGLEVTINVPYCDTSSCCEDVPAVFAKQTDWDEISGIVWPGEVVVFLDGGCPPFDWTIDGDNFTLDYAQTNSRRNRLHGAAGADSDDLYLAITDLCGEVLCFPGAVIGTRPCSFMSEGETQTITVTTGVAPIDWEFVGTATGWTLGEAQTEDLDNIVTAAADATSKSVTLQVTDTNGCTGTKTLYAADALEFQTSFGENPSVELASTGMAFLCCEGDSNYGEAYTFSVGTDMQVAQLDKLVFTGVATAIHSVCKAHSGVMCTAYQLTGGNAQLEAFLVDGSGNITQHASNTCTFHTGGGTDTLNIESSSVGSGVVVAVTYSGAGYAYAATVSVESDGEVNSTRLDYLQLTSSFGRDCNFTMISDTVGFCVYTNASYYLYARMFSVAGDGTLALIGDETQITSFAVYNPRVKKLDTDWVVVVGTDASSKGYAWALQKSSTSIVKNTGYEHEFDSTGLSGVPILMVVDSSTFLVLTNEGAGGSYGGHFWLESVTVGSSISWTDTYHYDYGDIGGMAFWGACEIRDSILLESYNDTASDGWLRTRRLC